MKIFNWIQLHKYQLMVIAFFVTLAILLVTVYESLKKDHSLDMVKMEMQLKEENRKQIIETRNQLLPIIEEKNMQLITLHVRDSILANKSSALDVKIKEISNPKYVKERIQKS